MTRTFSSITTAATALSACALGAVPWLAGLWLVVDPAVARTMLIAAPAGGALAVAAALLLSRGHAGVRWAAATFGLAAVASSPAFLWHLGRPTPSLARIIGPSVFGTAPQTARPAPAPASPAVRHPAGVPAADTASRNLPQTTKEQAGGRPDRLRVLLLGARPDRPASAGPGTERSSAEASLAHLSSIIRDVPSDRSRRADRLATAMAGLRPDVIVIPDAWCAVDDGCLVDRLAQQLDIHAAWAPATGSLRLLGFEEGAAILSRFPIDGAAASQWSPPGRGSALPATQTPPPDRQPAGTAEAGATRGVRDPAGGNHGRFAIRARIAHPEAPFDVVGLVGSAFDHRGARPPRALAHGTLATPNQAPEARSVPDTTSAPASRAGQPSATAGKPHWQPPPQRGTATVPTIIAGDLDLPVDQATMDRLGEAGYRRLAAHGPASPDASRWPRRSSSPGAPPGPRTSQHRENDGSPDSPPASILYRPVHARWLPLRVETVDLGQRTSEHVDRRIRLGGAGGPSAPTAERPSEAGDRLRPGDDAPTPPVTDRPTRGRDFPERTGLLVEFQLPIPPAPHEWSGEWQTANAADVGLDPARLGAALDRIGELDGLHGILVARHGRLVAERYWRGWSRDRLHNLKSTSKSILSALVGQAIAQGHLGLDQRIDTVLPEAASVDDPTKAGITVRHLLTMTSGLESTSFGGYGAWVASPNWVRSALARPLVAAPGTRFSYSTGGTHLLSATLARASGQSSHDFAREHLFAPLDIGRSAWGRDRQGIHMGGNNLSLLPRDMLKFGQLYLNRGQWGGRQVIPWQWVDQSTRPDLAGPPGRRRIYGRYGYLWWLRPESERGAYLASGYGGQYIYLAPAEDMVVATISTEVSKGREWRRELFGLIRDGVTGSVVERDGITVPGDDRP